MELEELVLEPVHGTNHQVIFLFFLRISSNIEAMLLFHPLERDLNYYLISRILPSWRGGWSTGQQQPPQSKCVHCSEWGTVISYNKTMARCEVWVWCVLSALERCHLSFSFFFGFS